MANPEINEKILELKTALDKEIDALMLETNGRFAYFIGEMKKLSERSQDNNLRAMALIEHLKERVFESRLTRVVIPMSGGDVVKEAEVPHFSRVLAGQTAYLLEVIEFEIALDRYKTFTPHDGYGNILILKDIVQDEALMLGDIKMVVCLALPESERLVEALLCQCEIDSRVFTDLALLEFLLSKLSRDFHVRGEAMWQKLSIGAQELKERPRYMRERIRKARRLFEYNPKVIK